MREWSDAHRRSEMINPSRQQRVLTDNLSTVVCNSVFLYSSADTRLCRNSTSLSAALKLITFFSKLERSTSHSRHNPADAPHAACRSKKIQQEEQGNQSYRGRRALEGTGELATTISMHYDCSNQYTAISTQQSVHS